MNGRLVFALFFLYIMFSGALRKWYFPSFGTPILLVQYFLAYLVYFTAPKSANYFRSNPLFQNILLIYIIYCVLEIFNIRGTDDIRVQFYGFAMHFTFVPLFYTMKKNLGDEASFHKSLKGLSFILIGMFLLGFLQYFSPPSALINKYAVDLEQGTYEVAVGGGGNTRITGTFSYLATYASFLCFILHILFFATVWSVLQKKLNWYYIVAYGMGIINLLMTGSRGATMYYFLTESLVLVLLVISGQAKFLRNIIPLMLLFIGGYIIIQMTNAGSTAIKGFIDRLTGLNDLNDRLADSFSPFKFFDQTGLFGFGIGTAQFPMYPYLTNLSDMPPYWEEEGERISIELGALGYIIIMILRCTIFYTCYKIYKTIKTPEHKLLSLTMTMYQLPYLINLQTNIFNYIDGIFYWMAIGIVYFAYQMEKNKTQPSEHKSFTSRGHSLD